uniref:YadA C-terminal domain-containing protein n=1 Tax=Necropsobacter massiliensis TaxID=1400001 RepID=UPI000595AC3B
QNKTDIAANKTALKKQETAIVNNHLNITENRQNIATNKTRIDELYKFNNNLKTSVTQNTARISNLEGRVDRLEKKMQRNFASQAALTGLFQPYNIGKFNLSAAVGGYNSETAFAIGTGYRFNRNVAAKAGIAMTPSSSSISYNAGVNFEW